MPSKLSDEFFIEAGSALLNSVPGVAGGKFLDLPTIVGDGALCMKFDPASAGPPQYHTAAVEVQGADQTGPNQLVVDFSFATIPTVRVTFKKGPAGSQTHQTPPGAPIAVASKRHEVVATGLGAMGTYTLTFSVKYDVKRVVLSRFPD